MDCLQVWTEVYYPQPYLLCDFDVLKLPVVLVRGNIWVPGLFKNKFLLTNFH